MYTSWQERQRHWQTFEAWERDQLRSRAADLSQALDWMADAWELARRFDPSWGTEKTAQTHWHHLAEIQKALARIRPRP